MSRHPLCTEPDEHTAIIPPLLLPEAGVYAMTARFRQGVSDWSRRYNRADKSTHRFVIADTRGLLTITIPVAKPTKPDARWGDILLSDHGRWQETVPTALESAYGRTPFFEFYADRLLPIFANARGGTRLMEFARSLDHQVRMILGLPPGSMTFTDTSPEVIPGNVKLSPPWPEVKPYWQVRADTLGFIPRLSILDLIFSLGPEAPLALR